MLLKYISLTLLSVLMPCIFVGVGIVVLRRAKVRRQKVVAISVIAFSGIMLLVVANQKIRNLSWHSRLQNLQSANVTSVQIGDMVTTNRVECALLAQSLKDLRCFVYHRGDGYCSTPVEVRSSGGPSLRFRVGQYARGEGVILEFYAKHGRWEAHHGNAYSKDLGEALAVLDVGLKESN